MFSVRFISQWSSFSANFSGNNFSQIFLYDAFSVIRFLNIHPRKRKTREEIKQPVICIDVLFK